jgi:hypothetical protein
MTRRRGDPGPALERTDPMTDQDLVIELEPDDTQGHGRYHVTDDDGWLRDRLGREPSGTSRISLKASDDDTEGHAAGSTVTLRAFDDDDTEGHAISIHFPSRGEADAFRRRLLLSGALAGTIAVGAVAGIGLSNLVGDEPAAVGAAAGAAQGMSWAQDERQDAAIVGAGSAGTMSWAQDERQDTGVVDTAPTLERDASGPAPR